MTVIYCVKCKHSTKSKNVKEEDKSGRLLAKGTCVDCGTKKCKIIGRGKTQAPPRKPKQKQKGGMYNAENKIEIVDRTDKNQNVIDEFLMSKREKKQK